MQQSTVKWFDAKKGYGFINHPHEGDDVFVHYSQILSEKDFKTLRTGQEVKFEMNDGPKGLHALDVKPLDEENGEATSEEKEEEEADAEKRHDETEAQPVAASSETQDDDDDDEDDDWEWDEEEWTDEHGNPPDPMAGPTF